MIQSQTRLEKLAQEYKTAGQDKVNQIKAEMQLTQIEFQATLKMWNVMMKNSRSLMSSN